MDYDELVRKKGILVSDEEGLIERYYGYRPQIGDKIQIMTENGRAEEFVVMGILKYIKTGVDVPFLSAG